MFKQAKQMRRVALALALVCPLVFLGSAQSQAAGKGKVENKQVESHVAATNAVTCQPTTATGHKPPVVQPPAIKMPVKNRIFDLQTNCGLIEISADGKNAPLTVLALTALANGGFFNQTLCHRLTTSGLYVLQCGDPTATGTGGPIFTYRDENLPTATTNNYPAGIVAMANSGPNTNGSQFFLVYANTTLAPSYTRWGKITKGLDILRYVSSKGVQGGTTDGAPNQDLAILSVTIRNQN